MHCHWSNDHRNAVKRYPPRAPASSSTSTGTSASTCTSASTSANANANACRKTRSVDAVTATATATSTASATTTATAMSSLSNAVLMCHTTYTNTNTNATIIGSRNSSCSCRSSENNSYSTENNNKHNKNNNKSVNCKYSKRRYCCTATRTTPKRKSSHENDDDVAAVKHDGEKGDNEDNANDKGVDLVSSSTGRILKATTTNIVANNTAKNTANTSTKSGMTSSSCVAVPMEMTLASVNGVDMTSVPLIRKTKRKTIDGDSINIGGPSTRTTSNCCCSSRSRRRKSSLTCHTSPLRTANHQNQHQHQQSHRHRHRHFSLHLLLCCVMLLLPALIGCSNATSSNGVGGAVALGTTNTNGGAAAAAAAGAAGAGGGAGLFGSTVAGAVGGIGGVAGVAETIANANFTDLGGMVGMIGMGMGGMPSSGNSGLVQSQQLIPHGSQQLFELSNKVQIREVQSKSRKDISYTFKADLRINSVWHSTDEQLLEIFIDKPSVSAGKRQEVVDFSDRPFYVSLIQGKPNKIIAHSSRDQSLLNIKRGIASLLQLQHKDGPVQELDVSGKCTAFYRVKSSTKIEKMKTDCSHWDLRVNYRPEKPLGVSQVSQEQVYFEISADGVLLKAESVESHRVSLQAKPDAGSHVDSVLLLKNVATGEEVQQLNYKSLEESIQSLLEWYRVFDLEADVDGSLSEIKDFTLKQLLSKYASKLVNENIGTQGMTRRFAKLIPVARITKQEEFVDILNLRKKLHYQLVDLLGSVQTIDAHKAMDEVFSYNGGEYDINMLEKYLQSLTVGTHPDRLIIEDLLQLLKTGVANGKLYDTILQTVASLTKVSGFAENDSLPQDVRAFLQERLTKECQEYNEECKTQTIRALQNLQDPVTLPLLLDEAFTGINAVSVAAMTALKSFPLINFNESHRQRFTEIFYELRAKHDTSSRTAALDILLSLKPTKKELGHLLDYLASNDRKFEIKTYVIQKLRMLAEQCPRFAVLLKSCLAERPHINNYHIIGQKGITTVLRRQLSQTPAFNESLLSVQEMSSGVLKRGTVELLLNSGEDEISTFKLGIFTSGLSSFVSEDGEDENEVEEPATSESSGMEITVGGVLLRPLIFFNGKSELMGHVWSGTASENTPAYQATTMLQDHEQYIILSSGATMYMRVIGSKSIDLLGKVTFSLWNRNAISDISMNTGETVEGHLVAGFGFAKVQNEFNLSSEPKISLQANLDFYSGVKLCMQLQRPEVDLKHTNAVSSWLSSSKKHVQLLKSQKNYKSNGRTLALNQKNNEMCSILLD